MMIRRITVAVLCALIVILPAVHAHDDETLFNVVNLTAQAEREIPNDQMTVILATEHEGNDPSKIAKDINRDMDWALGIVRQYDFVESRTRSYQTYPVYDKRVITGWRASQELELRSENIEGLSGLAGKLQEKLQVRQMSFSPTDATRKQYENDLIEEAMTAFKERVAIVKKDMGNKDHRIINIHINTGGYIPPPIPYERAAMKTMAMETAPTVEAGTSKITVHISGSVQFF
jgi:predicted secreted protein